MALVKNSNTAVHLTNSEEMPASNTEKEKRMYKLTITQTRKENTENNGVYELHDDVFFYAKSIIDVTYMVGKLEQFSSTGISYRIEKEGSEDVLDR